MSVKLTRQNNNSPQRVSMNWNMSDVPAFIAVVEQGGVSAAARQIRVPKSTVSRAIQRLEDSLQMRLLERNSRHLRVTSEGQVFYKHCQLIMEQVDAAEAHMNGLNQVPSGELTVSLPVGFSRYVMAGQLGRFQAQYPDVTLTVEVTPRAVDLIGDHIDVAVQVGDLPDSELIATHLFTTPLIWVGSGEQYRSGQVFESADALLSHIHICERRYHHTPIQVRHEGKTLALQINAAIESSDPVLVRDTVLAGHGIGLMPKAYCLRELDNGTLVEVAPDFPLVKATKASAVYTSRRMLSSKTRAFIDFLRELTDPLNER